MKEIEKYIGTCFSINYIPEKNKFKVFTVYTQHFYVDSLEELTPERFEVEIKKHKEQQKWECDHILNLFKNGE